MPVRILGTAAAVATKNRDNASLLIYTDHESVLVDCPGSPVQKLSKSNIDLNALDAIIITHTHADHVYGLTSLIHSMMPTRVKPIYIYGLPEVNEFVKNLLSVFNFITKTKGFEIIFRDITSGHGDLFYRGKEITIISSCVSHGIPGIALRIEMNGSTEKGIIVYSGDTGPCDGVLKLSKGADILIHESTFSSDSGKGYVPTHTTAYQAGDIAARAGVKKLILIHFDASEISNLDRMRIEAKKAFSGVVIIPDDMDVFSVNL